MAIRRLTAWLCLSLIAVAAHASEQIEDYQSDITVRPDGVVEITETITVNVEGLNIRRGIYRDFPTRYTDRMGNHLDVGFAVKSVRRDGRRESFKVEDYANGKRLRIGNAGTLLDHGRHTYEIRFETNWQISHLKSVDELYFNAIGHGWMFRINAAAVRVHVPEGAKVNRYTAFTGEQGTRGSAFIAEQEAAGTILFKMTEPLPPRNGMTIVVEWPAGFVKRPTAGEKLDRFLTSNETYVVGGLGSLGVLVFFLVVWGFWGRDPKAGVVVAQYEPPKKVSPGLARHISNMGSDHKGYAAAVVSMAVKGHISIREAGDDVTLTKLEGDTELWKGEKALAYPLFKSSKSVVFDGEFNQKVKDSFDSFRETMEEGEEQYFLPNFAPFWFGVALAVLATSLVFPGDKLENVLWFFVAQCIVMGLSLFQRLKNGKTTAVPVWIGGFRVKTFALSRLFVSLLEVVGALIPAIMALVVYRKLTGNQLEMAHYVIYGINFLICVVFMHLMKRRTMHGRRLLDEIDGFKLYLTVAEKDRLNFHNPPDLTPALFNAYLPYAIALGVETEWGAQFEQAMARMPDMKEGGSVHWYSSRKSSFNGSSFASSLTSSLSSSIAAAATPPSSSGGSGFGGSSGGGGGGGGGGGW